MIAVPKRARPHQPEPDDITSKPAEIPLKRQLIHQMAIGAVNTANELRDLIKLETISVQEDQANAAGAQGASHAIWNQNGEIVESLPLTATAGATQWFAEREMRSIETRRGRNRIIS